jgi:hypothetical protein
MKYYLFVGDDLVDELVYELVLAPDNIHIEEIRFITDNEAQDELEDYFKKYFSAQVLTFLTAKNNGNLNTLKDSQLITDIFALEPVFDNTAQMEYLNYSDCFVITIKDISN